MPRIVLALLSGVALALSFEPFRIVVLLPLSVALFLCCVHGRSLRAGAGLGLLMGLVFWHVHIFWMRVVGIEAWVALSLFMTLWFALLGVALAAVSRLRWWPLWSALVWVAIEVLSGAYPMSGFTWGRLVFATIDTPYAGWLPRCGKLSTEPGSLPHPLSRAETDLRETPRGVRGARAPCDAHLDDGPTSRSA